jgi:Ca2+-binding RTX toxin-like protein
MPRLLVTAAVALAAVVALPSLAQGATLYQDGHHKRILLQDQTGDTNLVSVVGSKSVVIEDLNVPIKIDNLPSCMHTDEDRRAVRCPNVVNVELDLGDGQDHVRVDSRLPVEIEGDAGRDHYLATTTGGPSQVDFEGGTGVDRVSYFYATDGVHVSVDSEPDDGRPGDADRIRKDVETVIGSQFADFIVGNDRTVELRGFDGDDQITGGSAAELLSGGDGNDRIDARDGALDSVDCGGWLLDRALVDPVEASITGCAEVVG